MSVPTVFANQVVPEATIKFPVVVAIFAISITFWGYLKVMVLGKLELTSKIVSELVVKVYAVAVAFNDPTVIVVVTKGWVFVKVTVPVADDTEIPVPATAERTPLFVRVTFPVRAPPPTSPVPAMTWVELETLVLNVTQSADDRYPLTLAVEVGCDHVQVPDDDAIAMPEAPLVAKVPPNDITPVTLLKSIGATAESDEVVIFVLKVVQSAEERNPDWDADEVAIVKVQVFEDEVIVSPVAPLVARVIAPCFALKVVQSAEERNPDWDAVEVA